MQIPIYRRRGNKISIFVIESNNKYLVELQSLLLQVYVVAHRFCQLQLGRWWHLDQKDRTQISTIIRLSVFSQMLVSIYMARIGTCSTLIKENRHTFLAGLLCLELSARTQTHRNNKSASAVAATGSLWGENVRSEGSCAGLPWDPWV